MTDIFRKEYKPLTDIRKSLMNEIKEKAEALNELYNDLSSDDSCQREIALAKTNLEQSVMWAIKGITI